MSNHSKATRLNKFIRALCLILIATGITTGTFAQDSYVDLRNRNLSGKVIRVFAPNVIEIVRNQHGRKQKYFVDLINVDFGKWRNKPCKLSKKPEHKKACEKVGELLDGEHISVEITQFTQDLLKGYVFLNNKNINHALIAKGLFPVDYNQSREARLVILEKTARCDRIGIWETKMGNAEEDMQCQD